MARPLKTGLDYFPFDVDFFNDEKIEAISGEFGIKGEIVAIKLLTAIYRNGYFIEWSEMLQMKMLKSLPSISKDLLTEIVQRLVKWNFFDEQLFNSDNVLTSRGIQTRYFEAMKRNSLSDSLPFLVVSVTKTLVNVTKTPVNVAKTPQKKEKEIKEIDKEKSPLTIQPVQWYFLNNGEVDTQKIGLRIDPTCTQEEHFFLQCWEYIRLKALKKVTGTTKLSYQERTDLREILKNHSKDELKHALQAFFGQDLSLLKGANAMTATPKHFLQYENFVKYLQAFHNQEQLFNSQNSNTRKRNINDL